MTLADPTARPHSDRQARARALVRPFADEYPFEGRWIEVDGVALHVIDEGPRDAPPLLMLHGNPTWSFLWRRLVRALSATWRVVALDHAGCGLSDKPQAYPYTLDRHVANVEEVVQELDLRDLTLVLHDWGGAIGMGFARRHPERVARLVLMNTAAFRSQRMPLRIRVCRVPGFGPIAVRGLGGFARGTVHMASARPLTPGARLGFLAPYGTWRDRVANLAFVRDIPLEPGHPSWNELVAIEEGLEQFRDRPTCILWGMRDWCFTPAFLAEWEERLPRAEVHRLPDAGHLLMEDAPERVEAIVRRFLETRPIPRRTDR